MISTLGDFTPHSLRPLPLRQWHPGATQYNVLHISVLTILDVLSLYVTIGFEDMLIAYDERRNRTNIALDPLKCSVSKDYSAILRLSLVLFYVLYFLFSDKFLPPVFLNDASPLVR